MILIVIIVIFDFLIWWNLYFLCVKLPSAAFLLVTELSSFL